MDPRNEWSPAVRHDFAAEEPRELMLWSNERREPEPIRSFEDAKIPRSEGERRRILRLC